MVYTHNLGVVAKDKNKLLMAIIAFTFAIMATIGMFLPTNASHGTMLDPFTQTELDTDWEADRQFPSDGVTSVSAFGRDDVARIGVDSGETAQGTFQRTEGIKTVGDQNFGNEVHVDLYVDSEWEDTAVRAGFWVVGDDGSNARDNLFGILEFVNNEPCDEADCSNQSNITDHEGFRMWDSVNGWTNLGTDFTYGEWVTLGIELDTSTAMYNFYIDGALVGSGPGGVNFIRELFLNSYNYGEDDFPTLNEDDYSAHWHVGELVEETGEIVSPLPGEVVSGEVTLAATYDDGDEDNDDAVQWAVRAGTCAAGTNTVAGNVDGFSDSYSWDGASFEATFDSAQVDDGDYCFIFNPTDDNVNVRETVEFVVNNVVDTKDECKRGGWTAWMDHEGNSFKNQGDCVSYIATGGRNLGSGN